MDYCISASLKTQILNEKLTPGLKKLSRRGILQHKNDPKHRAKNLSKKFFLKKNNMKAVS